MLSEDDMDAPPVRVLLIDDDEDDYVLTRDLLSEIAGPTYELEWEREYEPALALAESNQHDVYLIDYRLGEHDGLELLRDAIALGCRSPMILLTGLGNANVDEAAFNAGAADYLVKGQIDAVLLERSIRYCLARSRAEEERLILEQQLRQAQKMEIVGQLAGGIAHDFNNLLTAILGYAALGESEAALEGRPGGNFREIQSAAQRAADLIQQLLAFSRRQVSEVQILNLNDVVVDTQRILRRLIGENIQQEIVTTPDLGQVRADSRQLEQVLINVAVNARDAMPFGGKLRIETSNVRIGADDFGSHLELEPGAYVLLAISDNGAGIREEVMPHIFEPFFTTKDHDKGSGLGLSTCYGIVKQAGGLIEAKSEPNKGTRFEIYLPRFDADRLDGGDCGRDALARPDGYSTARVQ